MGKTLWFWVVVFVGIGALVEFLFIRLSPCLAWGEAAAQGGQALAGIAALLILAGFILERYKTKNAAALEAAKIFLEKVGPLSSKAIEKLRAKYGESFVLERMLNVEEFSIEWAFEHREEIGFKQMAFQADASNSEAISIIGDALNHLEYLSLHILQHGLLNNKETHAIQDAFVQLVEESAYIIMTYRFGFGENMMANVIKVYEAWRKKVPRKTKEERSKELGRAIEIIRSQKAKRK